MDIILGVLGLLIASVSAIYAWRSAKAAEDSVKLSKEALSLSAESVGLSKDNLAFSKEQAQLNNLDRVQREFELFLASKRDDVLLKREIQRIIEAGLTPERVEAIIERVALSMTAADPKQRQLLEVKRHARDFLSGLRY